MCGRPPLGSSERGEHRSAATGSGCRSPSARAAGSAGRAAKQWNQNSASLSLKKNGKKERKESEGNESVGGRSPFLLLDATIAIEAWNRGSSSRCVGAGSEVREGSSLWG
jgi:hypothetical protein